MDSAAADNRTLDGAEGEAFHQRYCLAIEQLRSWDISVPGGSRLLEYEKVFRRWAAADSEQMVDALHPSEVHALHEAQDVIGIVECFDVAPTKDELERLRWLPSDGFVPKFSGHSSARDFQFELVLTGWLRRAGVSYVMSTPDIVVHCLGEPLGIEAKRPKSEKQVLKAAKDARRALEAKKLTGVVAMSLDMMVRPPKGLFVTESRHESQALLLSRISRWRGDHLVDVQRVCLNSRFLVGLVLIATIPVLEGNALAWAGTTQRVSTRAQEHRVKWLIDHLRPPPDFSSII